MADDTPYRVIEVVGTSTETIEDAIRHAIAEAARKPRHITWFQVVETRGHVADGKVAQFQVTVRIGFTFDARA